MPRRINIVAIIGDAEEAEAVRVELASHSELTIVANPALACVHLESYPDTDMALLQGGGDVVADMALLRRARADLPVLILTPVPEQHDVGVLHGKHITDAVHVPWRRGELVAAVARVRAMARLRLDLETVRKQLQRRVEDLGAMNELTVAVADASSYDQLSRVLATGLFRIIPEGIGAAMLAIDDGATLHIHCHQPSGREALRAARDHCLETFRALTSRPIPEDKLTVDISGERLSMDEDPVSPGVFAHVPVRVDSKLVGVLEVSTDASVSTADEQQMYFLATRAAETIRRLSTQRDNERRRLGLMVESMADGIILTDTNSDRVLINPAARQMLAIEPAPVVTTRYLKEKLGFYPFELIGMRAESSNALIREEIRLGDRALHSIVSPVRDRAGKLVGVVVVLRDITEARELARRQSEFVSVVSHELRTPLTSIAGVLDIVLSGYAGRVSDKQRRYLDMARDSCSQLSGIVDDLLDVARSENNDMPVALTPLALDELSQEMVDRYRSKAEAKRIRLGLTSEDKSVRIMGDSDRLGQVLSNLLSNALKFTPQGGEIDVEVFGSSVVADHVGVAVFNSGEPIPKEARERVFAKFEQLEDASTRKSGGTGLGLPISRAIIEAHGGRIWAESIDTGTRFVFILPVAPSTDAPEEEILGDRDRSARLRSARLGTSDEQQSATTVLIIDDDRLSSYILKGILMTAGYEVLLAEDADSALTPARAEPPALAVINMSMTQGDGPALVEIFGHDPDMRKTAVLVMSADSADRDVAMRANADEFLTKPVQPALFLETCTRLIHDSHRVEAHRVLVVDDDPTIRMICREVLENAGYAVRDVGDGISALDEARRFRPDLMLLDVMMPKMDGFRTAELFRADPVTSLTPIIFVSAKGETSDKVRAFRAGAEDYVVKPFDAAELVARVAKSVERQARELGASPTTQLPGADAIEAEIERRLTMGDDDAFCYLDLDNLKAFNDYYGYAKADGVIRQTGDLIRDVIAREGRSGDFIGHIAGDDFVFITSADRVVRVCKTLCATFDRLVPLYYNKADREQGFIETKDRYGEMRRFPIMTVSVAAVTLRGNHLKSFAELAALAAKGKKLAKELVSSSFVLNSDVVTGTR